MLVHDVTHQALYSRFLFNVNKTKQKTEESGNRGGGRKPIYTYICLSHSVENRTLFYIVGHFYNIKDETNYIFQVSQPLIYV